MSVDYNSTRLLLFKDKNGTWYSDDLCSAPFGVVCSYEVGSKNWIANKQRDLTAGNTPIHSFLCLETKILSQLLVDARKTVKKTTRSYSVHVFSHDVKSICGYLAGKWESSMLIKKTHVIN